MTASPAAVSPPTPDPGKVASRAELCASCGRPTDTPFCPHCGERRAVDRRYSLLHFAREVTEAVTNADGRFLHTLWTLLRRPGELTAAYMRGERVRYMRPFQLFLVLNVAFFLVSTWTGARVVDTPLWVHMNGTPYSEIATRTVNARLTERGATLQQYRIVFDNASTTQAKSLVILMVPMFAVAVGLVSVRRRRYAVQHVVFSLHAFSALLLLLFTVAPAVGVPLAWAVRAGVARLSSQALDYAMTTALALTFGPYLALGLRRAYGDGWVAAAGKAVLLWIGLAVTLLTYRFVLFFTTFWAT
jgi:hypothetical protein